MNTLRSIAEIGGFKDVDQFFNSPQMIRQQMMMQQAQQQPPQPDPAMMKRAGDGLEAREDAAQAQIQLEREKMMMEIELERKQDDHAEDGASEARSVWWQHFNQLAEELEMPGHYEMSFGERGRGTRDVRAQSVRSPARTERSFSKAE